MVGKGRYGAVAVSSPEPVLSVVGPIGLAASITTALIVDMIGELSLPESRSLADLVGEGPRLEELSPGRPGVALIHSGGVSTGEAVEAVEMLARSWPGVVVRSEAGRWPGPTVPLEPLYPGVLQRHTPISAVWQPLGTGFGPPGPGPVLPRLSRRLANQILSFQLPRRSRWIRAWGPVWELPWG